jgi:toxin secretion/phage lysis holin
MSVKTIWAAIQSVFTAIGAWLGAWLGGADGLIIALTAFVIADYITGVLAAITEKRLSSSIGFKGISRKIVIFAFVGLAHMLDSHVLGTPGVLRTATIFFYLSNEGISLLENATRLGLPIPAQMRDALDAIANRTNTRPPLNQQGDTK